MSIPSAMEMYELASNVNKQRRLIEVIEDIILTNIKCAAESGKYYTDIILDNKHEFHNEEYLNIALLYIKNELTACGYSVDHGILNDTVNLTISWHQ